ncbi:MAG: YlzJ-like family protein [Christensenellales bacterium]
MILHTIMDLTLVFSGDVQHIEEFTAGGVLLQGVQENGVMKLVRVISSDPYVYLKDEFQIGRSFPLPFTK